MGLFLAATPHKSKQFSSTTQQSAINKLSYQMVPVPQVMFDNICNQLQARYGNSGIETAVKEAGGEILMAHESSHYSPVELPNGKVLKTTMVHKSWLDSD